MSAIPNPITQQLDLRMNEGRDIDIDDGGPDEEIDDDGGPDDVEDDDGGPVDLDEDDDGGPEEEAEPTTMLALTKATAIAGDPHLVIYVGMDGSVRDLVRRVNRIIRAMDPAGACGLLASDAAMTTKIMRVFAIFADPTLDKATRHLRALGVFQDTKNPGASLRSCLRHLKDKGLNF